MRGAIRMAALSEAGVIYVMTHDSIGLGEDGPTHQVRPHTRTSLDTLVVMWRIEVWLRRSLDGRLAQSSVPRVMPVSPALC